MDKKKLRAQAQALPAVLQVGKQGVTAAFIDEVKKTAHKKGLVKVRCLQSVTEDTPSVAEKVCRDAGLALVSVVGHTFVVFDAHASKQ